MKDLLVLTSVSVLKKKEITYSEAPFNTLHNTKSSQSTDVRETPNPN